MQTKKVSIIETCCNVGSGLVISYFTWMFLITPFGRTMNWDFNHLIAIQVFTINSVFTTVSIIRGYLWRRAFERRSVN